MTTYLGQNFLTDSKIQSYIADKVQSLVHHHQADTLIEIGPWKWAITKKIHHLARHFLAIEKDTRMQAYIQRYLRKDQIHWGDVLQYTASQETHHKTIIVGNLPYYITSPILRKFFAQWAADYAAGICMIQKEVGEKIHSLATKKSYLWRLLNYAYDVSYLKTVPAKCFSPAPKVDSCLIQLQAKHTLPSIPFADLCAILDIIAPYSRKTLWKIGKMHTDKILIPPSLATYRLEDCCMEDIAQISLLAQAP